MLNHSTTSVAVNKGDLIRTGPFRLFFPLGVFCGILGVGHWLLWSVHWIAEGNTFFHFVMQIQGFLTCFVTGFLLTALPRFLGVEPVTLKELTIDLAAALMFIWFAFYYRFILAEGMFIVWVLWTGSCLARRFPSRTKTLPDSFMLVFIGLAQALGGAVLLIVSRFGARSVRMMTVGWGLLELGFMLSLILGVAGHLTPFLMGYTAEPGCETEDRKCLVWIKPGFHVLIGLLLAGSFLLDAEWPRMAASLRATLVTGHLLTFARIARPLKKKTAFARIFWTSCWMVLLGMVALAVWPEYRMAMLHIVFIGGFSLMVFSFGLLVVLSHAARAPLLQGRLLVLRWVGGLVLLALIFRISADLEAWHYPLWIHTASGFWLLAALTWLLYVFPKLWSLPEGVTVHDPHHH